MQGTGDFNMDRTDNDFSFTTSTAAQTANRGVTFQLAGGGQSNTRFKVHHATSQFTGNVGIGTDSPAGIFQVGSDIGGNFIIGNDATSTNNRHSNTDHIATFQRDSNAFVQIASGNNSSNTGIKFMGAGDRGSVYGTGGYDIHIEPNCAYGEGNVIIKGKNDSTHQTKVGIGNTNPDGLLDVRGDESQRLILANQTAAPVNGESLPPTLEFHGRGWNTSWGNRFIKGKIAYVADYGDYGAGATQGSLRFSLRGAGGSGNSPDTEQIGMTLAGGTDSVPYPRLGIGTTTPQSALHVYIPPIAAGTDLEKQGIVVSTPFTSGYQYQSSSLLSGYDGALHGTSIGMVYESPGYALTFFTNNNTSGLPSERMRIDDNGNVGIGTNSINPRDVGATTLQIGGNGTRSAIKMHTSASGSGATDGMFIGYDSGHEFYLLNSEANSKLRLGTGTSPHRVTIDHSGLTLEAQTIATLNSSATAGTIAYVSDEGGQLFYKNASSWKSFTAPLGTASNPATSAEAILSTGDSIGDGAYYIKTSSGVVQTYCMMSWGGYMLAMKINNSYDNNFRYDGGNWTTTSPINESSMSSSGSADAVSRLYYDFDITDRMRVSLNTFNNYIDETSGGNIVGKTLKQCMTYTYNTLGSDRSRADFLNWIDGAGTAASNWNNQPNCNSRGFNVSVNEGGNRWGISMNNEGDCTSNDSSVGLGSHTNNFYANRTSNAGGSRWNPDAAYHYNAWVWVK
jgi:hypothetical protein